MPAGTMPKHRAPANWDLYAARHPTCPHPACARVVHPGDCCPLGALWALLAAKRRAQVASSPPGPAPACRSRAPRRASLWRRELPRRAAAAQGKFTSCSALDASARWRRLPRSRPAAGWRRPCLKRRKTSRGGCRVVTGSRQTSGHQAPGARRVRRAAQGLCHHSKSARARPWSAWSTAPPFWTTSRRRSS